jgi:folate-binding protein YgfZ
VSGAAPGLIELPERGLLAVTGPQRQKLLHAVLSNDVEGVPPGAGRGAALMDVKGRLIALLRVLVAPDAVLLEANADRLERVEGLLNHYRVAAPVRFARRPAAVLALLGDGGGVLGRAGLPLPGDERESHVTGSLSGQEVRVVRAGDLPGGGFVLHAAPEHAASVREAVLAAGASPLSREDLDVRRIEHGRPWYGPDVTEANLLHETGLLAELHSSSKGCYVGQEVVARLEGRGGNVSRRLRGLKLGALAAPGAAITADGAELGRLTTAGVSERFGPIAMGYVHRSHLAAGSRVDVGATPATVEELPFQRLGDR